MIEANTPLLRMVRYFWPMVVLCIGLLIIVAAVDSTGDIILAQTLTEGLVRMVMVVALYMFIGNSGIISFGHIAFVLIGAYATAWQTCCPYTRDMFMPGLPTYLLNNSHHVVLAVFLAGLLAAFVALIAGFAIMRLSGIAASIGTFAFFMALYAAYGRWSTWTSGGSTVSPMEETTTPWSALAYAVVTIVAAFFYARSRWGLALRATRDDEIASKAAGVNVFGQRLLSFVITAFFCGMAGGLYAHFVAAITVDSFYLKMVFITLSMLVVGGMQSLTGAVVGVVVLSVVIDVLRRLEAGIGSFSLPTSSAEVGVGLIMLLILLFRPSGITGNAEIYWPFKGDISSSGAMKRQS
ncbi:MAG: branched-chain amino acid ABC transporter permease [Rhodospirillaceae bacterium]|nr:branched-chain amino acid ABC transporter permease [Rhodospirillaceae bacterium]MBT3928414.1 branched-chain amino acid ABC transporter permease [Rhodospirillaceae bacterium]MBT4428750.1 branched-chain amino acid ABC transporter permease [Rhodospirillaceae bacterium]MBT5677456.1 branched-chain amino acid ABC transporter permease [Rhodospirillaceae bacterium]